MTAEEDADGSLGEITVHDGSDMTDNQLKYLKFMNFQSLIR